MEDILMQAASVLPDGFPEHLPEITYFLKGFDAPAMVWAVRLLILTLVVLGVAGTLYYQKKREKGEKK